MQVDFWSNVLLVVYILAWVYIWIRHKNRTNGFGVGMFIITTYCFYAVFSLLLFNNTYFGSNYDKLTLFPFIYLFAMLLIALKPITSYEISKIRAIQMPSKTIIVSFIIIYGICALVSIPSSISNIRTSFASLFFEQGAGIDLYLSARDAATVTDSSISGLYGLLNIFHNFFRDISVFILFYYLSQKKKSRFLIVYLIVVLVVDMFLSIANGGRTTFMMMLLTIGVAYFMFHDYWDEKSKNIVKWSALILLIIVLVPFVIFTISRLVGAKVSYSTFDSLLNYGGQANLNFNNYVLDSNGIRYGDRTFNEFKRLLGVDVPNGVNAVRQKYSNMTIDDRVFSTFVGDFVLDFGPIVAFAVFSVISFIFTYLTRSRDKSTIPFHKLIVIFFIGCICSQGGMYLFYYSFQRNWIIIAFILMYIIFFFDYQHQLKVGSCMYLEKPEITQDLSKKRIKIKIGKRNLF